MNYLNLCKTISSEIKKHLVAEIKQHGFNGETMEDPSDLKSTHDIDKIAAAIALEKLSEYNCNIFIESVSNTIQNNADFSVYIDPVDGSLNWERGVGDPCVVIAISSKAKISCLKDLEFSFVYGLRSNDIYYSDLKQSYYISSLTNKTVTINCSGKQQLCDATAYLRTGYGGAQRQLDHTLALFTTVRDIRSFDNAAIEMCEIARNAADVMIEARNISDFFNLLAYPILKTAGGFLTDLSGNELAEQTLEFESNYNYIACNNTSLLNETINSINNK
ncbi:hypothetical protein MNBD_GAMMA22-1698 [hydrothermal vent metagenome]|uniref:Inositol-phosphate phosphatase n=1 Tax=hydrothermal vent metagenome TaxID=652676 RepID=A0A3B1A9M6_9ZZZZ